MNEMTMDESEKKKTKIFRPIFRQRVKTEN
jgi:hypothetical protein